MTEAMAFAGSPNTITGKLGGRIDLTGRGTDAPAVTKSARGTARVEIRDGVVKNLGLLRAVVIATSMRADAKSHLTGSSREEPFSLLSATLRIANGVATTDDLRFESANLELNATGSAGLNGSAVDLKGKVQLSEALSQEAGSDLFRYTQEQGRVTLPATVTGSVDNLSARIDVKDAAQRALKNRAQEEAGKFLKKGLGGIFR
jgi:AsmA protein